MGETDREATEMAWDLLMLTIGDYMREGKPLPVPRRRHGSRYRPVQLTAPQAAKVDLDTAFLKSGLRKAEFVRRIGIPKTHIDRLFSLRHRSRLDQIESAFAARASACTSKCATRPEGSEGRRFTRISAPSLRPLGWRARPECIRRRRQRRQARRRQARVWPGPRD